MDKRIIFQEKVDKKFGKEKYTILGNYINNKTKIKIRCNVCGYEWETRPDNFMHEIIGCPKCSKKQDYAKIPTAYIIQKGKELYGDKFGYDKTDTFKRNDKNEVQINCNKCGNYFWIRPNLFISNKRYKRGFQCPFCKKIAKEQKLKEKELKKEALEEIKLQRNEQVKKQIEEKFPNFYDFKDYKYEGMNKNIILWHNGEKIKATPNKILNKKEPFVHDIIYDSEYFIQRAKQVHGDRYDYSKTHYVDAITPITIICKKHGEFQQNPSNHLQGANCPQCGIEAIKKKERITTEEFIKKAKKIHGDEYDYSKVKYVNSLTKILIHCNKCGNDFWQYPVVHLSGHGCPICHSSRLEELIRINLKKNNVIFEEQKRLPCIGRKSLDFYLPSKNVAIECQGKQHFNFDCFGGKKGFEIRRKRDTDKFYECKENGINILYLIPEKLLNDNIINNMLYNGIYKKENTFFNVNDLIKYIMNDNILFNESEFNG